jgi:hypothetical protein
MLCSTAVAIGNWRFFEVWSNDPADDKRGLIVGVVTSIVGLLFVLIGIGHVLSQPWDLRERGVPTIGVKAERDPMHGDRYRIEVDGKHYVCHRGAEKLGRPRVTVLYDPADPSRCRAEDTAGGLAAYERNTLVFAGPGSLVGFSLLLAWYAEPRPRPLREDPNGLLRPKLMWIARGLLALGVLLAVLGAVVGVVSW